MQTATSSGGAEQHRDHVLLDGQRGVVGSLCPGVSQDILGVGVNDDRGVRTMPRQSDAQPSGIGGERRRLDSRRADG